jgi:hypothetical protein
MAVDYRYLAVDIRTGAVQGELPLGGVSIERLLNGAGAFSGQLKLSDKRVRSAFTEADTKPGKSAIAVLRNNTLLWGGPIWTRRYDVTTETLTIGGNEWYSILGRRKVVADLSWTDATLTTVITALVNHAQADSTVRPGAGGTGANNAAQLNMTVSGDTTTNTATATGSVLVTSRKWVSDVINELSTAANGIDFRTGVAYSGSLIYPYMQIGIPLGVSQANSSVSVAEAIGGEWAEDATSWGTHIYASASGSTSLTTEFDSTSFLTAGYPELDLDYSTDTSSPATLTSRTSAYAAQRQPAGALSSVVTRSTDPDLMTYDVGDWLSINYSPNARFPQGLAVPARIVGWKLTPGEAGAVESVALTLAGSSNG